MIKVAIFDLDNTIYNYDISNLYAEAAIFKRISTDFGIVSIKCAELLSDSKRNVKERLKGTAAEHNRLLYMQEICEMLNIRSSLYAMSWYNYYWDHFLEVIRPYEYVIPTFEYLKSMDIKIGILTDLTALIQYRKIEKLGLSNYIDTIITSEEVGAEKPDKRMFMRVFEKTGCAPSEIVMIGDDLNKDIKGAETVGMNTIHYNNDTNILEMIKQLA